jgi:hypothetical protein
MNEDLEHLLDLVDHDCAKRGLDEDQAREVIERIRREAADNPARLAFYRGLFGEVRS